MIAQKRHMNKFMEKVDYIYIAFLAIFYLSLKLSGRRNKKHGRDFD
jgi:hypothetical protein